MIIRLKGFVYGAALSIALIAAALTPAYAGPFDNLNGQWSGEGQANLMDGTHEKIKCTATYGVNGNSLNLKLTCASSGGYKISAQSNIRSIDGFLSGNWTESTKNLGGDVSGSAAGNTITAKLESGGTPLMTVNMVTTGTTQAVNVSLQQGGHSLKNVRISLNKAA